MQQMHEAIGSRDSRMGPAQCRTAALTAVRLRMIFPFDDGISYRYLSNRICDPANMNLIIEAKANENVPTGSHCNLRYHLITVC